MGCGMLVISRMREESVVVIAPDGGCVITVLRVRADQVTILVNHTSAEKPGVLNAWTATFARGSSFKIGSVAEVTLVDVREEKARIGINASRSAEVHRLEVWQAIKREQGRALGDAEDGYSGSPVLRPGDPKPPSLDVRLGEPPAADD